MWKQLRTACAMLVTMILLTGLIYPLTITAVARGVFPTQAHGSLIQRDGKPVGSELIGQPFDHPKYFWSRPSATSPFPYNAGSSSGSNLAVGNPAQLDAIAQRVKHLHDADPTNKSLVPVDLVTASGSGLDPHISVAAAEYQVPRVARLRGMSISDVAKLVSGAKEGRQFGLLGEPTVNVLKLNLSLDELGPLPASKGNVR